MATREPPGTVPLTGSCAWVTEDPSGRQPRGSGGEGGQGVGRQDAGGGWVAVAKASADKGSKGGRKAAFRTLEDGVAVSETISVADGFERVDTAASHPDARALQVVLVENGEIDTAYEGHDGTAAARAHHLRVREELPVRALALSKSDPAIPTLFIDAPEGPTGS